MIQTSKKNKAVQTLPIFEALIRFYAEAEIKAWKGKRVEVVNEMRKKLEIAKAYGFNELVAKFAKYLHYYYLTNVNNTRLARKYKNEYDTFSQLAYIEDQVNVEFANIAFRLNHTNAPSAALKDELSMICRKLERHLKLQSPSINIYVYTLLVAEAFLHKQYQKVINLCEEVITDLTNRGIGKTASFYKDAAMALMITNQYSQAASFIERALNSVHKGSGSWLVFAFYQIVIELHRENYEKAYDLYLGHNNPKIISKQFREQWYILRGFLRFLSKSKLLEDVEAFRVKKFLNSTPISEMDKSGNNINIIILQMLLEGSSSIIDKEEAIRQYSYRHMKGRDLKRANLLLKFLINHAKNSYHSEALKRHTIPLLYKLKAIPLDEQNIDLEVIPYDVIAEIVLAN